MQQSILEIKRRLARLLVEKSYREGDFVLASGRRSDYYFDCRVTALHAEGSWLIGTLFNDLLKDVPVVGVGGMTMGADPLVSATTAISHELGRPLNGLLVRKEAKDHGEGGVIVGAPLKGKVVIIDDVISAGTSVRESVKIIQANGAVPSGVLIALDRQERGGNAVEMTETSAVQDVEKTLGMNVASIICLNDLLAFMNGDTDMAKAVSCHKEAVAAYRARYGA